VPFTSLANFTPTTLATVNVPAGSYEIVANATLTNSDSSSQFGDCELTTDPATFHTADLGGDPADILTIPVSDAQTFTSPTAIGLSCDTFNGFALQGDLSATRVGGIN
jgi:hypothetical protein